MPADNVCRYLVVGKREETPTVTTLLVTLADGTTPPYLPGQYITVYFHESGAESGRAYSISSAPFEKTLALTIRAVGEFSNRLCSMKYGDVFFASLPQGFFYPRRADMDLIMIAGGMGITAFRGMILDSVCRAPLRPMHLLYSIRLSQEALFSKELAVLAKKYNGLQIKKYLTRERTLSGEHIHRRIKTEDILRVIRVGAHAEFLICGSTSFVCDQRNGLLGSGIPEQQIRTEIHFQ